MQITKSVIDEHQRLYKDREVLTDIQNEEFKAAKFGNGNREAFVPDPENKRKGAKVKVTEKALWEEVRYLGMQGNRAADYLCEQYPAIFERQEKIDELSKKITAFEKKHFGFIYTELTMPNLLSLLEGMIEYKQSQ